MEGQEWVDTLMVWRCDMAGKREWCTYAPGGRQLHFCSMAGIRCHFTLALYNFDNIVSIYDDPLPSHI